MPTVADVLRQCGPAYLERYGTTMPAEHKKVLQAIMACRTGKLGMVLYVCESCGKTHAMGRSCGNRHCPTCQQGKTKAWLETQTARLLPCPYFLVTFTVPAELRLWCARTNGSPTRRCSTRPAPQSRNWRPTASSWAVTIAVSSACCTPGAARWSIIRTSTMSYREVVSAKTGPSGCRRRRLLCARQSPVDPVSRQVP